MVFKNQDCPFCQLLIKSLLSNNDISAAEVEGSGMICGKFMGFELQITLDMKRATKKSKFSIQLCKEEESLVQKELSMLDTSILDIDELRFWLKRCSTGHFECQKFRFFHLYATEWLSPY
jgi:hypothetical protein